MNGRTVQHSVVIVAEQHNPSILHPFFLQNQGIVPSDWVVANKQDAVVCTFPFSTVLFENGVRFTAEPGKFEVKVDLDVTMDSEIVPDVAGPTIRYINELPNVRYKAVGVNFKHLSECATPQQFVMDRFLKSVPSVPSADMHAFLLHFVYSLNEQTQFRLILEPATVKEEIAVLEGKVGYLEHEMLLFTANYHTPVEGLDQVIEAISRFPVRKEHFITTIGTVMEGEAE